MPLWATSVRIFNSIREHGKSSIRRLAERTGFSKSSIHRHLQAIDRRDRYPESKLCETPEGRPWLIRLVVATLFIFGLKRGVGAETLSEFFGRLHLEAHVGCSPSALRHVMHTLERIILDTAAAWEQEGVAHGEIRPIIGAVDETFLQRMMLVFMDLASGYLLMEAVAVDRTYDTWYGCINGRLKTFGIGVLYLVSDRAKALIKLAHTGLGCLSISDLFPLRAMTWPRAIRWPFSVVYGKPHGTSNKPSSAWRRCSKTPRQSVSTSSRYRPGSQSAPPRSTTGRG